MMLVEERTTGDLPPGAKIGLPPVPLEGDPHLLETPHRRHGETRERSDHLLDVERDRVVSVAIESACTGPRVLELDSPTDDTVQEPDADGRLPALA